MPRHPAFLISAAILSICFAGELTPRSLANEEPEFQARFPRANRENGDLLSRFRDEIASAAGLEGGLDGLDLPDRLEDKPLLLLGAHFSGKKEFALALPGSDLPDELQGRPGWSAAKGWLLWASHDEFPRSRIETLAKRLRVDSGDDSRRGSFEILLGAGWMGLPRPGDSNVVELPGGSLGQALASISQVLLRGEIAEQVQLSMEAEFPSPQLAGVVADAWRSVLSSFRGSGGGGAQQVLEALGRGKVIENATRVSVQFPLTEAALGRLQHARASTEFLFWRNLGYQREADEQAPEIFRHLGAIPGARLADLGAGQGFYSVRLARAAGPEGRVLAIDVADGAIRTLRERAEAGGFDNLQVIQSKNDDPGLAGEQLDGVLIVNAYHEMAAYEQILTHIKASLRPHGKLVLLEPHRPETASLSRSEQVEQHTIAPEIVVAELEAAGFEVIFIDRQFRASQHEDHSHNDGLVVARKP